MPPQYWALSHSPVVRELVNMDMDGVGWLGKVEKERFGQNWMFSR